MKKTLAVLFVILFLLIGSGLTFWAQTQGGDPPLDVPDLSAPTPSSCLSVYNWDTNEWSPCP